MDRRWRHLFAFVWVFAALALNNARADSADAVKAVEGLWAYTTLLASGTGQVMPLTGVILYKDGLFAQQSIFDGEPFDAQGAMAHAGPFSAGPRGVHMTAEQTISITPGKDPALKFRRDTQHDISVDRDGDTMTIVFGSGTVQKFKRIGPAQGDIYKLQDGLLALVDDHFVLVAGDERAVVTGFGKFQRKGSAYDLQVIRWSEATPTKAAHRRDASLKATFDGKTFALADGRAFQVVARK
ncbi:hypothetical protein GCM10011487_36680 [Steroidobacter agaridevorans]|uniref:META domain-containing protein n=1 Tax=Steroidobacter agaridevorans TaxID=2695856 RepID=A0A829YFQ3_9GAMM|nr:hypothetical protein [Steroidobacter agaridevorans]GFE81668.1 hypothetical protein GCM10011487_36680 [Steroidobacter agaridevorans]